MGEERCLLRRSPTAARRLDVEQLGGRVDSRLLGARLDHPSGRDGDSLQASLDALGSYLAVGIDAARGITVCRFEIELKGDLNITALWGTGDLSAKPVGFTDVAPADRRQFHGAHREVAYRVRSA